MAKRTREDDGDDDGPTKRIRAEVAALTKEVARWEDLLDETWTHVMDYLGPGDRQRLSLVTKGTARVSNTMRGRRDDPATLVKLEAYYKRLVDLVFRHPQTGERTPWHAYVALLERMFDSGWVPEDPIDTLAARMATFRRHYFYQAMYAFGLLLQHQQNIEVAKAMVPIPRTKWLTRQLVGDLRERVRMVTTTGAWDRWSLTETMARLSQLTTQYPADGWERVFDLLNVELFIDGAYIDNYDLKETELVGTGVLCSTSLATCQGSRRRAMIHAATILGDVDPDDRLVAWLQTTDLKRLVRTDTNIIYHLDRVEYTIIADSLSNYLPSADSPVLHRFAGPVDKFAAIMARQANASEIGVDAVLLLPSTDDSILATVVSRPRIDAERDAMLAHHIRCFYRSSDGAVEFAITQGIRPTATGRRGEGISYFLQTEITRLPPLGYRPFGITLFAIDENKWRGRVGAYTDGDKMNADEYPYTRFLALTQPLSPFVPDRVDELDAAAPARQRLRDKVDWARVARVALALIETAPSVTMASLDYFTAYALYGSIANMVLHATVPMPPGTPASKMGPTFVHYSCGACGADASHIRADGSEAFCARCKPPSSH
jgi:hypothetical protein